MEGSRVTNTTFVYVNGYSNPLILIMLLERKLAELEKEREGE